MRTTGIEIEIEGSLIRGIEIGIEIGTGTGSRGGASLAGLRMAGRRGIVRPTRSGRGDAGEVGAV